VIFRAPPQTHRRFDLLMVTARINLVGPRNFSMTVRAFGTDGYWPERPSCSGGLNRTVGGATAG